MLVYRIERQKYLATTLEGNGAALSEGFRWNSLNTRLVYTAQSRSLATLEVSVHLDLKQDLPKDRFYVEIDIPEAVLIVELLEQDLPKNWDAKPPNQITQLIGDDFVKRKTAAVLKVPSSIIPKEYNYLINPSHQDSDKITIKSTEPFQFDKRFHQG